MIDISTLFGLSHCGIMDIDDVVYLTLTEPEKMGVPHTLGQPMLGPRTRFENNDSFSVVLPFPSENANDPCHVYNARSNQVIEMRNPTPLVENHKIISMDIIKPEQLPDIVGLVKEDGGVTFFLSDPKNALRSLENSMQMLEEFCWVTSVGYILDQNGRYSDEYAGLLSFFHLQHCIPIFNSKMVDGLGMLFQVILPNASAKMGYVVYRSSMAMLAANHRDNLLVVDGCTIRKEGGAPNGLVEHIGKKLCVDSSSPKAKAKAKKGGMATVSTSYSPWTMDTSSTATFA